MARLTLDKSEKLCSPTTIERLFSREASNRQGLVYPLRAVWRTGLPRRQDVKVARFLISVPKKRLKHAVDRVAMRRRVRESYRLSHQDFDINDSTLDVIFIYVADKLTDYKRVDTAMKRLLKRIEDSIKGEGNDGTDEGRGN